MKKEFYTTDINKAVHYAEMHCGGFYLITDYNCDCGVSKAKILSCKEYIIYICSCSEYALKSKQL